MKIEDGLHLVLSGGAGFDLSDAFDCNVFMIAAGDEWILFDAGVGRDPAWLAATLAADGIDPGAIRHLFITHGHGDHSGGAADIRERLGLRTYAGAATAKMVEAGDEVGISLDRARKAGVYPQDYVYRACAIDTVVEPGRPLAIGPVTVELIETPGHSFDHVSYLVTTPTRRILIGGDALFWGGKVAIQDIYDCNIGAVCATVRTLASIDYDTLLPGHLNFSLRDARRHADAAMEHVTRMVCPPSIIV
ncbi:MAG: MBL fold metallo-hydrolase [Bauldia sp.]|nr:MBL fold metallo-hydrolase [Bauldia sp.]